MMEKRATQVGVAEGRMLTGYAARFNTEARIAHFTEVIRPGAFQLDRDVLALVDHDASKLLGRSKTGTLTLEQDQEGLRYTIQLPDTQLGRDVLTLAERGDLGGMSFGFTVKDEHWQDDKRELRSIDLHEISVVSAWPAYDGTSVQARSKASPRLALARLYVRTL